MKHLDLYLVGVGGQGILTIADILLRAAMDKGINCNYFPTKGMAQRGGFVKAQLRLGDVSGGPEISFGGADVVLSMELSESLKALDYLKPGGDMLIYAYRFLPTDVMLGKAPYPDEATVLGQVKQRSQHAFLLLPESRPAGAADNIFVLGAAQKRTALGKLFSASELLSAVERRFPKAAEANRAAFLAGQDA